MGIYVYTYICTHTYIPINYKIFRKNLQVLGIGKEFLKLVTKSIPINGKK